VPIGGSVRTPAGGYAQVPSPDTNSTISVAPNTKVGFGQAILGSNSLTEIASGGSGSDLVATTAENLSPSLGAALLAAVAGAPIVSSVFLFFGEVNAANRVNALIEAAAKQLDLAGNGAGVDGPGADIEVQMTASGSSFYVFGGSYLVANLVSGQYVTVLPGHEVFIPKSQKAAARENLQKSIRSFSLRSAHQWWNKLAPSGTSTTTPGPTTTPTTQPLPQFTAGAFTGRDPSTINFSSDQGNIVSNITWSSWTATQAIGQGTWTYISCVPDCATGQSMSYAATIALSNPISGLFTALTETTAGPQGRVQAFSYPQPWPLAAS